MEELLIAQINEEYPELGHRMRFFKWGFDEHGKRLLAQTIVQQHAQIRILERKLAELTETVFKASHTPAFKEGEVVAGYLVNEVYYAAEYAQWAYRVLRPDDKYDTITESYLVDLNNKRAV